MEYLKELNDVQREAVEDINGASLVIAGAGSGKTRVLTYRIAHLLNNGVYPFHILALTFTNKAAREMKERIANVVGAEQAFSLWMGTFHSIFARILRYEAEHLGFNSNFTIYDTQDSRNLIRNIIKEMGLSDKTYKPNEISNRISAAKNNLILPDSYLQNNEIYKVDMEAKRPRTGDIYKRYFNRCSQANAMDFDDLLLYTNILFRNHPDVLAKYQERFRYILVDEYQDTNKAQYLIVKKLAELHQNICVVGDDAQSIYSFRGANIENILGFQSDYPNCKLYKLEQNYRSTQTIVNAANSIIHKNKGQIKKVAFSEKEFGEKIRVIKKISDKEEAAWVADDIEEQRYRLHNSHDDYAVLYRTNAQSRNIEEALRRNNIPYRIYGGLSFYQRKEIKDLLAYFRVVTNPNDEEAIRRIINYPKRGIGNTTVSKLQDAAIANGISVWEVIGNLQNRPCGLNAGTITKLRKFERMIKDFQNEAEQEDAFEIAKQIATATGIRKELKSDLTPEGISRFENIEELLNGIQEFVSSANEQEEKNRLENYLENVALLTDQDNKEDDNRPRVTLMTIHAAKGLEFPQLYIVGMEEELFPSTLSIGSAKELEEERRLFYVALTRAEERATLTFAQSRFKWGKSTFPQVSRFIAEIDQQYLEYGYAVAPKFSGRLQEETSVSDFEIRTDNTPFQYKRKVLRKPSVKLPKAKSSIDNDFKPSNPNDIQVGMTVRHHTFGEGKVLSISRENNNLKATIFFRTTGQKTLLLKFAKLMIVGN